MRGKSIPAWRSSKFHAPPAKGLTSGLSGWKSVELPRITRINTDHEKMKHQEVTEKVIGVYYEVYNELGHGFLESVYEQAMLIALSEAGLHVARQLPITVHFRGQVVGEFRADIMVNNQVIVEIKAVRAIDSAYKVLRTNNLY